MLRYARMTYELTNAFKVAASLEACWKFFSTAGNLPRITPPWLRFTIDMPSMPVIEKGTILNYTIRWSGLRIRWQTLITEWEPMTRFVDLQQRGPYALWHHEHCFERMEDGVLCSDRVLYRIPFGPVGRLMQRLSIRRQLIEIFTYRRAVIGLALGKVTPVDPGIQIAPLWDMD